MLFALRKASRQPQGRSPKNHPPSFPNSQGAEQHPDFLFFLFRRIRKKVVNANKPERREFRINLLRPKKWSELCVAANARVKKRRKGTRKPPPFIFDPQFWLVLCYKRAEISIGFPFAFMIANTPLFAPNCSEETAAKAQKKQSEKEINFLSTSFPLEKQWHKIRRAATETDFSD